MYTWTSIDADTKLIPSWLVCTGGTLGAATEFLNDVTSRMTHLVQFTTDGYKPHVVAVEHVFRELWTTPD